MQPFDWRTFAVWDVTYACPLRCLYCYSESGRRASRMLDDASFTKGIEALIEAKIRIVAFSGGEPTLVPMLIPAARRLRDAQVLTNLYTSGFGMDPGTADELVGSFRRIHVSIDGATSATHDRIRARAGSFDQAIHALEMLVPIARRARTRVGVEVGALRTNLHEIGPLCRLLADRFPTLHFITIGAAIPSGLATRASIAAQELLDGAELEAFRSPAFRDDVARNGSPKTAIEITDNWHLLPSDLQRVPIQIEPDGRVRAFPIYEGTVGNILEEPLETIWERARARHVDPEVVALLSNVTTVREWAEAARKMDLRYGADADLSRIRRRQERAVGERS